MARRWQSGGKSDVASCDVDVVMYMYNVESARHSRLMEAWKISSSASNSCSAVVSLEPNSPSSGHSVLKRKRGSHLHCELPLKKEEKHIPKAINNLDAFRNAIN